MILPNFYIKLIWLVEKVSGACYDENKKYILGINSSDLDENLNYVIKAGVKFIRVSIEKSRIGKNISNYILYVIYKIIM